MKVKRNLSTPETRAWWAHVDRQVERWEKMNKHDLEKSFVHSNPEPTTDPPTFPAMQSTTEIIAEVKAQECERCATVCETAAKDYQELALFYLRKDRVEMSERLAHFRIAALDLASKLRESQTKVKTPKK